VAKEKQFFLHSRDERLVPRGLLFDGPPGTGKTMAAKYLAYELAVPLYRLDVSGVKGKYVGESESSFSEALRRIESSAPCVVLLDEVEKLFAGNDTSGVTQGILASLLWWLQEHGSRVLTVMTTNKVSTVPAELYRPGRIDEVYKFSLLESTEAQKLAKFILKTYDVKCTAKVLNEALSVQGRRLSHSEVAKVVKSVVKDALWSR
jgi:SpoVK/Ycf46/Vps4 family AAA+-type ATPase